MRLTRRGRRVLIALFLLAFFTLGAAAGRLATATQRLHWYRAWVVCPGRAEDSFGHLRLVKFGPDQAVYRCETKGY